MARSSAVSTLVKSMLAGGALASAYMAYKNYKDVKDEKKSHKGDIEVPLSRREFLSVVRDGSSAKEAPKVEKVEKSESEKPAEKIDVGRMTPAELAAIKRKLLRKAAEVRNRPGLPTKVRTLDSNGVVYSHPTSTMARVSRDASGRFAPSLTSDFEATTLPGISKKAQVFDTAGNIIAASIGVPAGILLAQRLVGKMIVNRRKADLVESKRKYVEELSKEVNDSRKGEFKYANHANHSSEKLGKSAGVFKDILVGAGGFGIALPALVAGISGILTYRVMENRRIRNEKESDKDLTNFPEEKHVKYKFAEERPYSPFNWVDTSIVNPAARLAHRLGRKVDDAKVKALDFLPGSLSGKLMTNAYLKGDGNGNRYLTNKILSRKGTASDLYDYLASTREGQERLQELVGKQLGNKWYTGLAKWLANTSLGRQMVMGKILEKTLHKVNGSTDLAMACLTAGGKV